MPLRLGIELHRIFDDIADRLLHPELVQGNQGKRVQGNVPFDLRGLGPQIGRQVGERGIDQADQGLRLARDLQRLVFQRGEPHQFFHQAGQELAVAIDRFNAGFLKGRELFGLFQQQRRKPADRHQRGSQFMRYQREKIPFELRFAAFFGDVA
ncbi:MAG: hypothetical protein A2992_00360 [Elusimicrobia bacterium RIFCSPLOWO2_01_FULL_59_12]|nr:MAG: hypothetical protein A2992_00360 [Elusimicrobia bacterium RIFCSPLOWO2_01_FULL_59_12]